MDHPAKSRDGSSVYVDLSPEGRDISKIHVEYGVYIINMEHADL